MIDITTWKKAWALLDGREQRNALIVLVIVILSALSSAVMIGSVLPFLSVLADPGRIESVKALAWAYEAFGFTSDYVFLIGLGLASLGVIVLASMMQIVKSWAVARFATMRSHSISQRLISGYLRQPYEFFLNRHSGEMSTRILSESGAVVALFIMPAAELVAAVMTTFAIAGVLIWYDPVVTFIAFAVLGTIYGAIYIFTRRALNRRGRQRVATNSERFRIANEALGGIKDIKLLGREGSYVARYAVPSHQMAQTQAVIQVISQVPQFALQSVAFGGMILLCLLLMDAEGLASGSALGGILPTLGLFAFAGQRLMPELSKLYMSVAQLQAGSGAVDTIHEDLIGRAGAGVLPTSIPDALGLRHLLELDNISYHYPDAAHAGLRDVSFQIRAGEKIGIVGATGAGKTTLADLVLGLLSPKLGRVVVDGQPVTASNLKAWQQSVAYVPQNIFLSDATVIENIALGVPANEIDEARAKDAARIAQLDKFLCEDLPDGYATTIGERGVRLSGGQGQRIGIARALYHNADLIVFDEATSALDNLTEKDVMAAIDALPGDKTVMMIAHRLSTVKRCDRIIVLDQGRLVGCDTWDALIADNPAFQRLVEAGNAS